MKTRIVKIAAALFFLFFVSIVRKDVFADTQSKTITYDLSEDNVVNITYQINLVNEDPNSYIAKYTLSTGIEIITNISARMNDGQQLSYFVRKSDGAKTIEVIFPQPNRFQRDVNWTLSFSSNEPAKKIGKVREVTVPGFIGEQELSVIVKWPKKFGNTNYVSSSPSEVREENNKFVNIFTDPQIKDTGVFLSIGETQLYDFAYKYQLKNDESARMRANITLPPDYQNQQIFFNKADPEPDNTFRDEDGNYIIEYIIEPDEEYEVSITGTAQLTSTDGEFISEFEPDLYLKKDLYWETDNREIETLANEITAGKDSNFEKAQAIYDYVARELKYNENALTEIKRVRLGAAEVLKNKKDAICQEFTDLFVTLCRAAGVPSRMLAGYTTAGIGYDLPPNTLHAWAEFYSDDGSWIPVDPTWQSTSEGFNFFGNVGLNHFVLAIRGSDSENPPLVLSFISSDDTTDNLRINPVDVSAKRSGNIILDAEMPDEIATLKKSSGKITVFNDTNQILSDIYITVSSKQTSSSIIALEKSSAIFPGEIFETDFTVIPNKLFQAEPDVLNFVLSAVLGEAERMTLEERKTFDIKTNSFLIAGFLIFAAGFSVVVVFAAKSLIRKIRLRAKEK